MVFPPDHPVFQSVDAHGKWTGLDVDICRAVAAATLGDATKVEFIPLAENESFTALLTGKGGCAFASFNLDIYP